MAGKLMPYRKQDREVMVFFSWNFEPVQRNEPAVSRSELPERLVKPLILDRKARLSRTFLGWLTNSLVFVYLRK